MGNIAIQVIEETHPLTQCTECGVYSVTKTPAYHCEPIGVGDMEWEPIYE